MLSYVCESGCLAQLMVEGRLLELRHSRAVGFQVLKTAAAHYDAHWLDLWNIHTLVNSE